MEAALLSGFIKVILPKLLSMAAEKYKLKKSLNDNIRFLEKELRMIVGAIDDELSSQIGHHGAVPRLATDELRELAHDIEDCIESIIYRATREQQSSPLCRTVRSPKTLHINLQSAQQLQRLRKLAEEANERMQRYTVLGQPSSATHGEESSSSAATDPRILDTELVGVDAPRAELLEQLAEAVEGQPKQLKVISIVGFCGLGKTALAADVYNRETGSNRFEKHAWVCAAHKGPREVLTDMLRKLSSDALSCQATVLDTSDIGQLCVDIKQHLEKKRYFIVIDDIRTEDQWEAIKLALPADEDVSSRVVVTTTIRSLANACSSANGYVHKMSRLDKKCSKQLFSKKACPEKYSRYKQPDSAAILKKCDGQPLALVTIGRFLQTKDWPTGPTCEDLCNQLHYHLNEDKIFANMRRVLIRNYTSLPGHALKACLLYFGMFPSDHPIRRKSLLRRWLAEGFFGTEPSSTLDPVAAFDALMDQNIVEPINVSNNDNVKTCQIYGMMHEFILHMCVSQNFVTLFCDEMTEPKYVRRLSLHHCTVKDGGSFDSIDLLLVRSLTIFGEAGKTVLDFNKYQLLRVLDLEKCYDLKDDHLQDICNLLLLKYLSLGVNVTRLPRDIAKLKKLETLDVRKTKVKILPVEVFQLPCLIHLFGKFKLPNKVKQKSEVQEFLSKGKSNLKTLSGFATDGSEGFLRLFMGYMNKLRKVKILCELSAGSDWTDLKEAIEQFIRDEKEANIGTRSLSLHFDECSQGFINSLEGPCYLSSLKLHGSLPALPQFVVSLRGLIELCISSTKLTTGVLEALSNLSYLKYLKLIAHDLEKFIIKDQAFPRLLHLCFVLQCPTFPTIEEGALPFLVTLQLLCKNLDGLSDIKFECLKHLQEVTLDPGVTKNTREKWEYAAKKHPNRPKVLLLKSVDTAVSEQTDDSIVSEPAESETSENSVASEGPVQGTDIQMLCNQGLGSPSVQNKRSTATVSSLTRVTLISKRTKSCEGQSSSNNQLNSAFNNMGHSEVSPALNELSNGMVTSYTYQGS